MPHTTPTAVRPTIPHTPCPYDDDTWQVRHVWEDFAYWGVTILTIFLALVPRAIGKAWSVLFVASASRKARRLALRAQQKQTAQLTRQVTTAQIAPPLIDPLLMVPLLMPPPLPRGR